MERSTLTIRIGTILLICIPVAVMVLSVVRTFAFIGTLTAEWTPGGASEWIRDLEPDGAVSAATEDPATDSRFVSMQENTVTVPVNMPRSFVSAEIEVTARLSAQSVLEAGIQRSATAGDYAYTPIANTLLASDAWSRTDDPETGLSLLQQTIAGEEAKYDSVASFLDDLENVPSVAHYHVDLLKYLTLDAPPSERTITVSSSLRGKHRFLTYVHDGTLSVSATFQDINRGWGADRYHLNVYRGSSELVGTQTIDDDGIGIVANTSSPVRTAESSLTDLPAGVYMIELDASDDLVTRSLSLTGDGLVAVGRLFLVDNDQYAPVLSGIRQQPTTVTAWGDELEARTDHIENLQTLTVGRERLTLTEAGLPATIALPASSGTSVTVPQSDVDLHIDGMLTFPGIPDLPAVRSIRFLTELRDPSVVQYIVTHTVLAGEADGEWTTWSAAFALTDAYVSPDREIWLRISAPERKQHDGTVDIRSVRVILHRPPFSFSSIPSMLGKLLDRI